MLASTKFIGGIDLGSNAIRLIIGKISKEKKIKTLKEIRESVRLGHDVFLTGSISREVQEKAIQTFLKFKEELEKYSVLDLLAVGTSALRESKNSKEFIKKVKSRTKIELKPISGEYESKIIYNSIKNFINIKSKNVIMIDVGGGSIEIIYSKAGRFIKSKSFKLGAVRLLERLEKESLSEEDLPWIIEKNFKEVREYIHTLTERENIDFCIGTGGNFDRLSKLRNKIFKKSTKEFNLSELNTIISRLTKYTYQERIKVFDLKEDRADVIIPAAFVIQKIMEVSSIQLAKVPRVGLKEGLLFELVYPP